MLNIEEQFVVLHLYIHRLHLNKSIRFLSTVKWVRSKLYYNAGQTVSESTKVLHADGISTFDQQLTLRLRMEYDRVTEQFKRKNTELSITVEYEGKTKSGGIAKLDAAQVLNGTIPQRKPFNLYLSKCPDPKAFLVVSIRAEEPEYADTDRSIDRSQMTTLGQDLSLVTDLETGDLNPVTSLILNDPELAGPDYSQSNSDMPQPSRENLSYITRNVEQELYSLRTMNDRLLGDVESMKQEVQLKEGEVIRLLNKQAGLFGEIAVLKIKVRKLQQQIVDLKSAKVEATEAATSPIRTKTNEPFQINLKKIAEQAGQENASLGPNKMIGCLKEDDSLCQSRPHKQNSPSEEAQFRYNELYEKAIASSSKIPESNSQKVENQVQYEKGETDYVQLSDRLDSIERENLQLKVKIAAISHQIAQIFNAAYEKGGPPLLDYLQDAIGLIQS